MTYTPSLSRKMAMGPKLGLQQLPFGAFKEVSRVHWTERLDLYLPSCSYFQWSMEDMRVLGAQSTIS